MKKFIVSTVAITAFGLSFNVVADDSMKGMDMSKMPMHDHNMSSMKMDHGMPMHKEGKIAHGVGVIKEINVKACTIKLSHDAIKEINWPPMVMSFVVAKPELLNGLKVGQKASFDLRGDGMKETVVAIKPTK